MGIIPMHQAGTAEVQILLRTGIGVIFTTENERG